VFFARPSAGVWHHYAFVLDTTASAAQQITPYVDGKAVTYTKLDSGTGAGNFANSSLYLMSRAAAGLYGAGDLDEVAKYEWALDGNGSFETSTGTTPTASRVYTAGGPVVVGLRVTDNGGGAGTTTRTVTIEGEAPPEEEITSNYSPTVLDTAGLIDYWRL